MTTAAMNDYGVLNGFAWHVDFECDNGYIIAGSVDGFSGIAGQHNQDTVMNSQPTLLNLIIVAATAVFIGVAATASVVWYSHTLSREDTQRVEERLTQNINDVEERLTQNIDDVEERLTQNIDDVEERLTQNINDVEERLTHSIQSVDKKVQHLDEKVQRLDEKVQRLDGTVQRLDGTVQRLDGKVQHLDGTVQRLDGKVDIVVKDIGELKLRMNDLENKHDRILGIK